MRDRTAITVIALLAAIPYLPALSYGFVFDDAWTLVANPWLRRPLRELLRRCLSGDAVRVGIPDATRPLMIVSTWIDMAIHGPSAFWMHLSSVVTYVAVCLLAGLCAFAILRNRPRAIAAATLFTVGAAHAEAVVAINYREDLLAASGLFGACAWTLWPRRAAVRIRWDILAALAWMAGLLAKENAIALVGIVALSALSRRETRRWLAERERLIALLLATLVVWGSWRWALALGGDGLPRAPAYPAFERWLRLARYECWILRGVLAPTLATPVHDTSTSPSWWYLAAFALEILATVIALRSRRFRDVGLALGWVVITSLPTSPLARPFNEQADRYLLVPGLGGAMLWSVALSRAIGREKLRNAVLLVLCMLSLGVAMWNARCYRSDATLWARAVRAAPGEPRAWSGLSYERRQAGDLDGAGRAAERAVELDPSGVGPHVTRAYARLASGDRVGGLADLAWVSFHGGAAAHGYERALRCAHAPSSDLAACLRTATNP